MTPPLEDPLGVIDAQIHVLEHAREDCRGALIAAEQDVVAAGATENRAGEERAQTRATGLRAVLREFSADLDQLRDERHRIIPRQRPALL